MNVATKKLLVLGIKNNLINFLILTIMLGLIVFVGKSFGLINDSITKQDLLYGMGYTIAFYILTFLLRGITNMILKLDPDITEVLYYHGIQIRIFPKYKTSLKIINFLVNNLYNIAWGCGWFVFLLFHSWASLTIGTIWLGTMLFLPIWLIPFGIASRKKHPQILPITILNILLLLISIPLGMTITFLAWLGILIWSLVMPYEVKGWKVAIMANDPEREVPLFSKTHKYSEIVEALKGEGYTIDYISPPKCVLSPSTLEEPLTTKIPSLYSLYKRYGSPLWLTQNNEGTRNAFNALKKEITPKSQKCDGITITLLETNGTAEVYNNQETCINELKEGNITGEIVVHETTREKSDSLIRICVPNIGEIGTIPNLQDLDLLYTNAIQEGKYCGGFVLDKLEKPNTIVIAMGWK
jgi:hypothetical protein